jgi:hypothetical protein
MKQKQTITTKQKKLKTNTTQKRRDSREQE